ncbi:MAG: glutaminyl-peptide cyclotransferase [Crocinitomicaceae bacterium]
MKNYHTYYLRSVLYSVILVLSACAGEKEKDPVVIKKDVELISPSHQEQYVVGDPVSIEIRVNQADLVSELQLFVDDTLYQDGLELKDQKIQIDTKNGRVGNVNLYLKYKDGKGKEHRDNRRVIFFSDVVPEILEGELLNTYPHQVASYTQGLEFYKGSLYEGTGRKGMSVLAEVDLKTAAIIRSVALPADVFGEGITILNDTIYQITYQSGRCFVYDINFKPLTDFYYSGQGWGLCNNGKQILMSNGSSEIVWRNPRTFEITKKIEVFDDQSNIPQLNELELIDGYLYANMYTDNRLVKIDTTTGKVISYIDFTDLAQAQPPSVDYFNGIAFDEKNRKLYVTGKLWPNLYEIKIK